MDIDEKEILFNKFKILKCYKKDEFSAVYLADHIYLEKNVFLKILDTSTISDINIVERFKREARILAKLDHPNIIKVYDFGTSRKFFYISFEYFASQNLREFVHKKNIKESVKKDIVVQLLKGLSYIHSKNIIHRDIKPENILINENIHLKLTDFGLAQISHDQNITQKFAVVGTPAYMSPEQIHGEELTIKSDLFSLGITIFELYEGNNPFLGKDSNGTIGNILSFNEAEIENKLNDFPDEIKEILKTILVAEPSKRANNISNLFDHLGIDQKEVGIKRRKSGKFKILFPIFLLISSVGLFLLIFEIGANDNDSTLETMNENKHDTVSKILNLPTTIDEDSEEKALIAEKPKDIFINIDSVDNSEKKTKTIAQEEKELEIEFGELYVKCYPWANIHINNEYVETTPLRDNIKLLSGDYLLTLVHPDYPDFSDSIRIKSSKIYSFEINLDTLLGFFNCQVYPWCEVYINGEMKGITPIKSPIALYPGIYDLELRNPDYETYSGKIDIVKNDTLSLKYNLENLKK